MRLRGAHDAICSNRSRVLRGTSKPLLDSEIVGMAMQRGVVTLEQTARVRYISRCSITPPSRIREGVRI